MPVKTTTVRFQLSGGITNENPNLALGSDVSIATNRNIQDNFLHNLFDEVTNIEAVSGDQEFRCVYFRNGNEFKLRNCKLIVLADSTSIWSKIEFAKGVSNNGFVEPAIPNENTPPAGISETDWKVPTVANPIQFGDVEAGSTAAFWLRRKVEIGALIAKNEKVKIMIIGDPPIPTVPPINCSSGTHYDSTTGTCVDDPEPPDPDCDEGEHKDEFGICVPNSGTDCPEDFHLDNGQCVPDGSPPVPTDDVIVITMGDIGCNDDAADAMTSVGSFANNNMFFANGDLSYTSDPDCFLDFLDQAEVRDITSISLGNHDDDEDESSEIRTAYISEFGIPSVGYYSFNIQNIHFLVMDTQSSYSTNSAQYTFVRNDLIQYSQDASIDWIVVFFHKPMYTLPSQHAGLSDLRDIYHPMFDTYKVDLVVSGHNHTMQVTHPIHYNASSPSSPTVVSTGVAQNEVDNVYTNPNAPIFAVCGSGGRALDNVGSSPAHFAWGNDEDFGPLALAWINNNKTLSAIFFRATGESIGEEVRSFTVHKL